jgi:hypothetical protein
MRPVKHSSFGAGDLRAHDIRLLLLRFFGFRHEQQLDLFSPHDHETAALAADPDAGGLFDAAPPQQLQVMLGLIKRGRPRVVQRAILVACIGWIPLLILSAIQGTLLQNGSFVSFITDYGAIGRYLIAMPVLVFAETATAPRLSAIAQHFREAGLVVAKDLPRFREVVLSTLRLRDSIPLELAVFVIAFAATAILTLSVPLDFYPPWHLAGDGHARTLSPAGWWDGLISTPLLVVLILGWLWRLVLWTRFLLLMSRLDLRLISAHPDKSAGLSFVGMSLQPFAVVAFALGAILAGTMANRVLHDNVSILDFKYVIPVFVALMVALFSAPLLIFSGKLFDVWQRGIFEYGALARSLGRQMEARWLNHAATPETLDANDFSATTDLYAIVLNVYAMNLVPVSLRNLVVVAIGALLPFVPVVIAAVSPVVLFQKLTGMLL